MKGQAPKSLPCFFKIPYLLPIARRVETFVLTRRDRHAVSGPRVRWGCEAPFESAQNVSTNERGAWRRVCPAGTFVGADVAALYFAIAQPEPGGARICLPYSPNSE